MKRICVTYHYEKLDQSGAIDFDAHLLPVHCENCITLPIDICQVMDERNNVRLYLDNLIENLVRLQDGFNSEIVDIREAKEE